MSECGRNREIEEREGCQGRENGQIINGRNGYFVSYTWHVPFGRPCWLEEGAQEEEQEERRQRRCCRCHNNCCCRCHNNCGHGHEHRCRWN